MNSNIKCKNPVIICNPYLAQIIRYCDHYVLFGVKYKVDPRQWEKDVKNIRCCRNSVDLEIVDHFYMVHAETGEIYKLYYVVPCGKCLLCRDKKSKEWALRGACESAVSPTRPVFITLTFDNQHLPKNGIEKSHVQKFLKRIRIGLDRLGFDHNIRYFACGEYGSKTGRPHYHLELFGMPKFPTVVALHAFIRKQWKFGFVYVQLVFPPDGKKKGSCSAYIIKYMRKDNMRAQGKNPVFFLSSRKNGGLGKEYFMKNIDFYRKNPDLTQMSVTDPWTGQTTNGVMPTYFRQLTFPTLARLIPKEVRDAFERFQYDHLYLEYVQGTELIHKWNPKHPFFYDEIMEKYSFLPIFKPRNDYYEFYNEKRSEAEILNDYYNAGEILHFFYVDFDHIMASIEWLRKRQNYLSKLPEKEFNIDLLLERINYNILAQREREFF
jgi:hypothetical protein